MSNNSKKVTTVGMLCAMALALNFMISFPMVPAVSFLKYDPKDIIIVIGGFLFGPMTSLLIAIICSVLEIIFRGGTILDILMNVISSAAFACTAAFIYKKKHTRAGAIAGLLSGVITTTICMLLWNFIITPIYFNMPRMDIAKLLLPGFLPFNLLKSGLNASVTFVLYKGIVRALRKANLVEPEQQETSYNKGFFIVAGFICISIIGIVLCLQNII